MKKALTAYKLILFCICCFAFTTVFGQIDTAVKQSNKINSKKTGKTLYGQASFYSNKFDGRQTANGEIFRQKKFTAACNSLPMGTWIEVTNLRNGKVVVVKINDRLHPKMKRLVDLTRAGAESLGFISAGLTRVKVTVLKKQSTNK